MRERPPAELVALLQQLGIAGPNQVRAVAGHVRRLARDLPRFESVWVDALAQARVLTPFQAAEINAGRGPQLAVGPFVLCQHLRSFGYAGLYRAREIETGRDVQLWISTPRDDATRALGALEQLARKAARLESESLAPIQSAGICEGRLWAACRLVEATTVGDFVVHNGRLPPEAALATARQVAAALWIAEQEGVVHGDLGAQQLRVGATGQLVLSAPGYRGAVRPVEGLTHHDLPPEAYDYLAPERLECGTPPSVASDVYAFGCLCWHLVTGRAPFAGGNSLAKLRAVQLAKLADVQRYAVDVPPPLLTVIAACTRRDPEKRLRSFADVSRALGPAGRHDHAAVARCFRRPPNVRSPRRRPLRTKGPSRWPLAAAALAGALVAAVGVAWLSWSDSPRLPKLAIADRQGGVQGEIIAIDEDSPVTTSGTSVRRPKTLVRAPTQGVGRQPVAPLAMPGRPAVPSTEDRAAPASFVQRLDGPAADGDLVLASHEPIELDVAQLRPGQRVRSAPGMRCQIAVPPEGLIIDVPRLTFENLDFVWGPVQSHSAEIEPPLAMIRLRALEAALQGCWFRVGRSYFERPIAISWETAAKVDAATLPTGVLELTDCMMHGVAAGIRCRLDGAVVLQVANTLHLGPGPLVELSRPLQADEPLVLDLRGMTLRGAEALVAYPTRAIPAQPGKLSIQAADCAFAPGGSGGLLRFFGPDDPATAVRRVQWTGQGSLLAGGTPVAAWWREDGTLETIDDDRLEVAGLVRSEVKFAGEATADPAMSRVTGWQVPRHSPDPPGIGQLWPSRPAQPRQ